MDHHHHVWRKRTTVSLTTTTTFTTLVYFLSTYLFKSCECNSFLQISNERPIPMPTYALRSFKPQFFEHAAKTAQPPESHFLPDEVSTSGHLVTRYRGHRKSHRNRTGQKRRHHRKKNRTHHGSSSSTPAIFQVFEWPPPTTAPHIEPQQQPVKSPSEPFETFNVQDLLVKSDTNEFSFPIINEPVEIQKPQKMLATSAEKAEVQNVKEIPAVNSGFGRSVGVISQQNGQPVETKAIQHVKASGESESKSKSKSSTKENPEKLPKKEPVSKPKPTTMPVIEPQIASTPKGTTTRPVAPELWVQQDIKVVDSEPENVLDKLNEEKRFVKKKAKSKPGLKGGKGRSVVAVTTPEGVSTTEGYTSTTEGYKSTTEGYISTTEDYKSTVGEKTDGDVSSTSSPDGGGESGSEHTTVGGKDESTTENSDVTNIPSIDFIANASRDAGSVDGTGNKTKGAGSKGVGGGALPTKEQYDEKCGTKENLEKKSRCMPSSSSPAKIDVAGGGDVDKYLNWYNSVGSGFVNKFEDKYTHNVYRQNRKLAIETIRNAIYELPERELEPKNGFRILNITRQIFSKVCPNNIVPSKFLEMVVVALRRLYEIVASERTEFIKDVEYGWIEGILNSCLETASPANYITDSCHEEVYAVDSPSNLLCLGYITNMNKKVKSTACYQTNMETFDPVLDVIWLMFEAVKGTCFDSFQGNSRLLHRYSLAVMDLITRQLKRRWPLEVGGIKFWERVLGPGILLSLTNIDKCLQHITSKSSFDFRTPRFLNFNTVRLSHTFTEFLDIQK